MSQIYGHNLSSCRIEQVVERKQKKRVRCVVKNEKKEEKRICI
jgi:hypothetical protein